MLQPSWEGLLTFSSEMVFITLYLLSNLIIDEVVTTTIRSATLVFTFTCPKLKRSISSRYMQQGRNEGWSCSLNFHNWPAAVSNTSAPGVYLLKLETCFFSPFSRALDRVFFLTQLREGTEKTMYFFSRQKWPAYFPLLRTTCIFANVGC